MSLRLWISIVAIVLLLAAVVILSVVLITEDNDVILTFCGIRFVAPTEETKADNQEIVLVGKDNPNVVMRLSRANPEDGCYKNENTFSGRYLLYFGEEGICFTETCFDMPESNQEIIDDFEYLKTNSIKWANNRTFTTDPLSLMYS